MPDGMKSEMLNICFLIPIYNNKDTITAVLDRLAVFDLPCLVINDGSNKETRDLLEMLDAARSQVHVIHLPQNGGKGAAVKAGLLAAHEHGYSHALQIDADGQHETADVPLFLEKVRQCPNALVLGVPVFGEDAPAARRIGRLISRFWVWIETLSFAISDPLFGFRVYPVAAAAHLINTSYMGSRMDFDPEIAVRLCWAGVPIENIPTRVSYPEDGVSHFMVIRDNLRISWMHTRLVCGMLLRLPLLLLRRVL